MSLFSQNNAPNYSQEISSEKTVFLTNPVAPQKTVRLLLSFLKSCLLENSDFTFKHFELKKKLSILREFKENL